MIKIRNGKEIEFVVASGALGWDGRGWLWERPLVSLGLIDPALFTITTKTMTLAPNKGRWWAVRPMRGGVWNNMGLPNKGMQWWLEKYKGEYYRGCGYGQGRKNLPYQTLVSIAPWSTVDLHRMVKLGDEYSLSEDPNFVGYELNVSCPNTIPMPFDRIKSLLKILGDGTKHEWVTILKLNYQQAFYSEGFTKEQLLELLPYCSAISLNSAPRISGKGAYSGKLAQEYNWATAEYLQELGFHVVWPSLWEYDDMKKAYDRGANAVSFGAVHLLRPWAPSMWVRRFRSECKKTN
jgi:hypothetical protein